MNLPRVGMDLTDKSNAAAARNFVLRAEAHGLPMAWSTVGRAAPDPMTYFAAAAEATERIILGTAIVPTYPRHPIVMASQTAALEQLTPGRYRLGIGPSHRLSIEGAFGIPMGKPLEHLREYLTVLRPLLWEGQADFDGTYYSVHIDGLSVAKVPIYVSALRSNAFRLAGELADGAISWVCPLGYLREKAQPAMLAAAKAAGRPAPRMIAHVPVVMSDDRDTMAKVARPMISRYASQHFYARMFDDAGFPVGTTGEVSDDLLDHLIVWGSDEQVRDRLAEALSGEIDEILVTLIPADNLASEEERIIKILASLAG